MFQRLAVAASCVVFLLLSVGFPMAQAVDKTLLAVLAILACIEKLGSVMNLVAVERDWVCHASVYEIPKLIALSGGCYCWRRQ